MCDVDDKPYTGKLAFIVFLAALVAALTLAVVATAPAYAMGDNIAGQLLDNAQMWLTDKWNSVFDPIWGWIFLTVLALFALGLVSWFAPFDFVKKMNAVIAVALIAFTFGGWKGSRAYKERYLEEREKRKAAEQASNQRRQQGGDGGDSGGFWPFKW